MTEPTTHLAHTAAARYDAVTELFDAMEALAAVYRSLPAVDRPRRCAEDAERITGELARRLCTARARLSSNPRPR